MQSLSACWRQRHVTIKIRVRKRHVEERAGHAQDTTAEKKVYGESLEWLAKKTFDTWQIGVRKGNSNLTGDCLSSYGQAVRLGFKGHQMKWIDRVLEAGGMSMDDFPPADPRDPRPNKWPAGKPEGMED